MGCVAHSVSMRMPLHACPYWIRIGSFNCSLTIWRHACCLPWRTSLPQTRSTPLDPVREHVFQILNVDIKMYMGKHCFLVASSVFHSFSPSSTYFSHIGTYRARIFSLDSFLLPLCILPHGWRNEEKIKIHKFLWCAACKLKTLHVACWDVLMGLENVIVNILRATWNLALSIYLFSPHPKPRGTCILMKEIWKISFVFSRFSNNISLNAWLKV